MTGKRLLFMMAVGLGILILAVPMMAQDAPTGPAPVGIRPDAPPYAVHGPYWVGATEYVIDRASDRPLNLTVWYPALNTAGDPETITYTIVEGNAIRGEFPQVADWSIFGHAIADAPPALDGAPYPLVVYSHGVGGWGAEGAWSSEHLASYGFVVIAADYPGEAPWFGSSLNIVHRANDTRRIIDFAQELTVDGELAGLIDAETVAVVGYSMGGTTALNAGGAQFDMDWFDQWCIDHPEGEPRGVECGQAADVRQAMLDLAGLNTEPEGLWPAIGDERVQAVVVRAGVGHWFGSNGLASVDVPVMVQGGTFDGTVPLEWGAQFAYENVSSEQRAMVLLENGDHMLFENACHTMPWVSAIQFEWLCSDAVWDMDRAHDLVNHFTTAFLLDTLTGDADAHAALAPDAVAFPGITYAAEGF